MIKDIYNWLNVAGVPQLGTLAQFNLWKKLMLEEIQEMEDAFNSNDLEEIKDAYADLIVVNTNLPFMLSIPVEQLEQKIQDVSKSNWSKFCDNETDAYISVNLYKEGKHPTKLGESIEAYYEKVDNLYVIKRTSDSKILKSHKFREP